jgi:hypothetical protein
METLRTSLIAAVEQPPRSGINIDGLIASELQARRRRRAAVVATGGTAAVLLIAGGFFLRPTLGGAAVGGPGGGSATSAAALATSDPSTCAPEPSQFIVCSTDAPPSRPPHESVAPLDIDVFATLTRLLPLDSSTEAITDPLTQLGFAAVNITDPQGTTRISVNVELGSTAAVAPLIDCSARNLPDGTQCSVITLASGGRMLTGDGPNADGPLSIRMLQVDLLYPDGRRVYVGEWNAADEKRGAVSRSTPLLTIDQLVTLATAPDWRM